ncbi:hematopoietic prostaglandin D synthase-like [Artemia franciscana]|uniref:hematopoietic prostaglandin D synthase-like n=1 Tax=Artemia franciscana TaxID=6661 RepID=UPI0032DB8FA3
MVNYKLTYFNLRGKAEVARLLFAYAKVNYEDVRIEREQWPEIKPKMPYGQVPVLEVDGKPLAQSLAIARFLGREFGLLPESSFDQAIADELADLTQDMFFPSRAVVPMREPDEAKRNALKPKILEESIYPILNKLEDRLSKSASGWLVGDKVTWVDFVFFNFAEIMRDIYGKDYFTKYDNLKSHYRKIKEIPQIAEYLQGRPPAPL